MWMNSLSLGGGDWTCGHLFNDLNGALMTSPVSHCPLFFRPDLESRRTELKPLRFVSHALPPLHLLLSSVLRFFSDGIALLEAIEKVAPGTVDMKKVNSDRAKLNTFKKASVLTLTSTHLHPSDLRSFWARLCVRQVENCNLAVALGKRLGLSLPGLGGTDIAGSNPKLVLGEGKLDVTVHVLPPSVRVIAVTVGFVWQLMRQQVPLLIARDPSVSLPHIFTRFTGAPQFPRSSTC